MMYDYIALSLSNIKHKKTRSWLTMVGIFVGIAAIVSLISLGQGMQEAILSEFQKMGTDRIVITPGGGIGSSPVTGDMSSAKLTSRDVDVIKNVKGIDISAGVLLKSAVVQYKDESKYGIMFGTPVDTKSNSYINKIDLFLIESGRSIEKNDIFKATIGNDLAYKTFKKNIEIGSTINVNGIDFKVVGIQKKSGSPIHDIMIRTSIDTVKDMFNNPDEYSTIYVQVKTGFNADEVAKVIEKDLRKERGLKVGEEDFQVRTPLQLLNSFLIVFTMIQAVLVGIAAVSLLVGGIGVMNTMYTSVLERTKDIGLMKAIGARNSDILFIFLLESGILGIVGGLIGVGIGIGISKTVEIIAAYAMGPGLIKAYISPLLIFGALAFSFTIGCISGLMPARQAAMMKPVDALRYE